jgi:uncharacterized protein
MILDFSAIPADGLSIDRCFELAEASEADGTRLVPGRVRLVGHARHGPRGVELQGRLEAEVHLECSRCLETFETPVGGDFSLILVSEAAEFGTGEKRLVLEDAMLFYADRGKVDLRQVAREQIHLNLPLKPVCRADCGGLCPTCGANRNRIKCSCQPADVDPRLAPLLAFKKQTGGSRSRS